MKRNIVSIALLLLICAAGPSVSGNETPVPAFEENINILYALKGDQAKRGSSTWTSTRYTGDGQEYYTIHESGKGSYGIYEDILWTKEAVIERKKDVFQVQRSTMTVFDLNNSKVRSYTQQYDHENKKLVYTEEGPDGALIKRSDFPLKGPVCDYITLVDFVRLHLMNSKKPLKVFYLLSNEPKLYKINMKDRGALQAEMPYGKQDAVKMQLLISLGPLTPLIAKLIPPTYILFTPQQPYHWLQYEGLEVGIGSPTIVAYRETAP